jgi:hypothetical protein
MKKNIFKKVGRVFTSLVLVASICLTMSVSVFATGYDLDDKNINYRDYLYFVIDGKDYKMTALTTEPGVDFSGSDVSAEVYAKVDMDGLNAAMQAAGSKDTFVLNNKTYMSRYEKSTDPIVYNFQDAGNGTYAIVDKSGAHMTLDNLAHVATVGLYIGKTADSSTYYFGMDALVTNLFKLNILGKVTAKAMVNYKDAEGTVLRQLMYETETTGYWGENVLVEYADLPLIGTSYKLAGDTTGAYISYGLENEINVTVERIEPDFTALEAKVAEVEKFLDETEKEYTEESMNALTGALTVAKNILANKDNAIQEDVNNALTALTNAKDALVLVPEEPGETVDLKALKDKVAEVEKFLAETKTEYTKESMKALKDALADAKAIIADPENVKQADVDKALKALTKAKEGLVPVTGNVKETADAKQESKAPVTGDNSFAGLALSAVMLCLAAGTVAFVKRKHI